MNAEIVSVGTELLLGQIIDTHAATMARILAECGISCRHRATVGDNLDRAVEALRLALSRSDVVVTVGGLGPTADDLTRALMLMRRDCSCESRHFEGLHCHLFTVIDLPDRVCAK